MASYTGTNGDDKLIGSPLDDTLQGLGGNDILDGRAGVDRMEGGAGADIYHVDTPYDLVFENAGAGLDTIYTSRNYTLPNNVEIIYTTNAGGSHLTGNAGANHLFGSAGSDILDGAGGGDRMEGGAGGDTYHVDSFGDLIVEQAGAGLDTIYASRNYTLPDNVEAIYAANANGLSLTGNNAANHLFGGGGNDILNGAEGGDRMEGGAGADTYYVDHRSDQVIEQAGGGLDTMYTSISPATIDASGGIPDNIEIVRGTGTDDIDFVVPLRAMLVYGNAGNNRFDDFTPWIQGTHKLFGGDGNDEYHISFGITTVTEYENGGIDTIYSDHRSRDYQTLPDNVENLVYGVSIGHVGILRGNDLDNRLIASGSADSLDGRSGADYMAGGAGGDQYYVDNIGDEVVELSEIGLDRVQSSVDYTLPDNVEIGRLTGTAQTLIGNSKSNHLTGNASDNILDGLGGTDRLSGFGGADTFRFGDDFGGDVITDFLSGNDIIDFSTSTQVDEFSNLTLTRNGDDILVEDGIGNSIIVRDQSTNLDASDFFFGIV